MKKLLATVAASATYLALPISAFAVSLDPCAGGAAADEGPCSVSDPAGLGIIIGNVVNMIFVIGVIAALGFLVWGGFKWLTSGGDKEGVESARNTIIAAIVGLIIIFLSYVVLNLVLVFLGYPSGISGITITPLTSGL